jgi:hypothetical protein
MNTKLLNKYISMKYNYIILIILILGTISCKKKQQNTMILLFSKESVINDKWYKLDSIVINKSNSKILMRQYRGGGNYLEITFIRFNNGFSEIRKRFYGLIRDETDRVKSNLMPIDTLPVLSKRDTDFTFSCNRNFYHSTMDLSLGDARYKIEKRKNTYVSSRTSTIDSTYKEEYYYDSNFNITKFIVKYGGNICIYK